MHSFSFGEIVLIFGIVVILFGSSRLASIGKSLGEGIANFKKGLNGETENAKPPTMQTPESPGTYHNPVAYTPPQVSAHTDVKKQANTQVIDVEQKEI